MALQSRGTREDTWGNARWKARASNANAWKPTAAGDAEASIFTAGHGVGNADAESRVGETDGELHLHLPFPAGPRGAPKPARPPCPAAPGESRLSRTQVPHGLSGHVHGSCVKQSETGKSQRKKRPHRRAARVCLLHA